MALKYALQKLNKNVFVFSQDIPSDYLNGLLNRNNEIIFEKQNNKFDLGIVVDCGEISRIGDMEKVYKNCNKVLNIDHHLYNENFTEYKIVDETASSTCEIIYKFIKELNISIDKDISLALYCGMATDSGCFMFNISPSLHSIANELVKNIDDVEQINYILFRQKDYKEIKLYGNAIKNLELIDNNLAITCVTNKDFKATNTNLDNTTGLIFLLSGIVDAKVICVISEEKPNCFKASFRSNVVDVCSLAKIFGGGGHKFASGCKLYGSKNTVKQKIIDAVKGYLCTE